MKKIALVLCVNVLLVGLFVNNVSALDSKKTQKASRIIIGCWQQEGGGTSISFDSTGRITELVLIFGPTKMSGRDEQEGRVFYRLNNDEKTGELQIIKKIGEIEKLYMEILKIDENSMETRYYSPDVQFTRLQVNSDGSSKNDRPLEKPLKWTRTSKKPKSLSIKP